MKLIRNIKFNYLINILSQEIKKKHEILRFSKKKKKNMKYYVSRNYIPPPVFAPISNKQNEEIKTLGVSIRQIFEPIILSC
jgi:hypothetical protein